MMWIINKGDLILSTKPLEQERELLLTFGKKETRIKTIPVYKYLFDSNRPEKFWSARRGKLSANILISFHRSNANHTKEMEKVGEVEVNLTTVPARQWGSEKDAATLKVIFRMVADSDGITASVWRNDEMIDGAEANVRL